MDALSTGQFIKKERLKLKLSQKMLGEMLHVEPQTVSKWERGLGLPDYDNILRLKEIFNCELSDILEPKNDDDSIEEEGVSDKVEETTNLPVLVQVLKDDTKKKTNIFSFFSRKNLEESISRVFGVKYEDYYYNNRNFFFKGVGRKRTKEEYKNVLTYGLNSTQSNTIDIQQPWLYLKVLVFLLICFAISSAIMYFFGNPLFAIIFGSCFSVLPLLTFVYESNFSRDISILQLLKLFSIGGLLSIFFTLIVSVWFGDNNLFTCLGAPIIEEIVKAIVAIVAISYIAPKNVITGILIGFAVGAGFDVFETMAYGFNSYFDVVIEAIINEDYAYISEAVSIVLGRSINSFFSGHHFFTGIFAGIYVLFKKQTKFTFKELFQWQCGVGLLIPITLHALWNTSSIINDLFFLNALQTLVNFATITIFFFLINLGISQMKAMGIYQSVKDEEIYNSTT